MTDEKHCAKCHITKPVPEFYPRNGAWSLWCKDCFRRSARSIYRERSGRKALVAAIYRRGKCTA